MQFCLKAKLLHGLKRKNNLHLKKYKNTCKHKKFQQLKQRMKSSLVLIKLNISGFLKITLRNNYNTLNLRFIVFRMSQPCRM